MCTLSLYKPRLFYNINGQNKVYKTSERKVKLVIFKQ